MYQVALKALTYQALAPLGAAELGANGSVFNSKYLMPSFRFTVVPGLEVHTQFLGGAGSVSSTRSFTASATKTDKCGFSVRLLHGLGGGPRHPCQDGRQGHRVESTSKRA